jgi:hypothetical protein
MKSLSSAPSWREPKTQPVVEDFTMPFADAETFAPAIGETVTA